MNVWEAAVIVLGMAAACGLGYAVGWVRADSNKPFKPWED